jgi:hypothetical protein
MKIDFTLLRNLRKLFGFSRAIILVYAVLVPLLTFVQLLEYRLLNFPEPPSNHRLAEVALTFNPGVYQLTMAKGLAGDVALTDVRGTLEMNGTSADAELKSLIRWDWILRRVEALVFGYLFFDLLYKLCGNVERSEIFSEKNTRLVRNLGFVILGSQVVCWATGAWYAHLMKVFLEHKVATEGIRLQLHWSGTMVPPDLNMVMAGFLVLVLAKVFRQGLALKKENELTV